MLVAMNERWFVELYEEENDKYVFKGMMFESAFLGHLMPVAGDVIIAPEQKADFADPRNPALHDAYEVVRRYIVPDLKENKVLRLRLLVNRRSLTEAEAAMFRSRV